MATDIVIPDIGESVTTGVVSTWLKADGEYVDRDEIVLELDTDKVTMEITAPAAGVLKRMAAEGDEVEVGAVIGTVDESAEKPAAASAPTHAEAPAKTEAAEASSPVAPPPAATAAAVAPVGTESVRATPLAERIALEKNIDLSRIVGTGAG